jgi:hypothetical protein
LPSAAPEPPPVERESRAAAIKRGYTAGARSLASRSITGLARTGVTPNALTTAGVTLCAVASVLVLFENRNEILFYWAGAVVFVVGSVLDILDGALARGREGDSVRRVPRLDHRPCERGLMLTAIAYVRIHARAATSSSRSR